jgi:hypothetical protein
MAPVSYELHLDVAIQEASKAFCWYHPRVGAVPGRGKDGQPLVVMTMQKHFLSASDYFSGLHVMRTEDLGRTWTLPEERPELGWRQEEDGVTVGICDVTPGWHAKTGVLLAIGHTVRYANGRLVRDPRPRETAYATYEPKSGNWQPWKTVEMPDKARFFSAGCGCGQWLVRPDGSLLVPFYFKGHSTDSKTCYSASVMHCSFDGKELRCLQIGNLLTLDTPRGLYEPSIARHGGRFYMTLRNDVRGYVAVSEDGLHYGPARAWTFDDGTELGSYNTQQHWAAHRNGLFLAYTRRGAGNDHIPRHRAPIFIAQVDPARLCVIRKSERVAIPERGAELGNFGVSMIDDRETWLTVGEGMSLYPKMKPDRAANGSVFVARMTWARRNSAD